MQGHRRILEGVREARDVARGKSTGAGRLRSLRSKAYRPIGRGAAINHAIDLRAEDLHPLPLVQKQSTSDGAVGVAAFFGEAFRLVRTALKTALMLLVWLAVGENGSGHPVCRR